MMILRDSPLAPLMSALLVFALVLIVGCGGGGDKEQVEAERPHSLVPAALDSLTASAEARADSLNALTGGALPEQVGDPMAEHPSAAVKVVPSQETLKPVTSAPARTVTRPKAPAGGSYSLQLGSFRQAGNAASLADQVKALGHTAVVESAEVGGILYHRVFVRGLPDRTRAENLGEELRAGLGISYLVLKSQ